MSDTTDGKPTKKLKVVKQCKINDVQAMVKEAWEAMGKVLEQREKDLTINWGETTQAEFLKIFGSEGKRKIEVELSLKGDHHKVKMTAREIMLDGIRRFIDLRELITLDDFINYIYDRDHPDAQINGKDPRKSGMPETFTANVNGEQESDYKINIGINFIGRKGGNGFRACATVMGVDSRVATLCHEMSHFVKKWSDPSLGGMGTSDYDVDGNKPPRNVDDWTILDHQDGAAKMVSRGDPNVFDNAYNIEKYFEIEV
ncbi:hypothetical protein OH773_00760 [Buttiauxella sp. WJP83]|uniref:hypothetical protein n=1 Tax=Buttiauxella sp. WJP83 TaxID=2986951 RepID=UPI0022DE24CB|nr:hypothetical protein [Buttiauxella sp. WJP83]WBM70832.1 hypothetical protein OH773_00760 [Buttiauxella sp. WJP83]